MIRALAIDIDGTLTDHNRVLCPAAVESLRKLNMPVVLSTGNTHCFTRAVSVLLGTPRIFIAENGGVVSHSENDIEILADRQICEDAFQRLKPIFPLERYDQASSSHYRFTDIAVQRNFDVLAAKRYVKEMDMPIEILDTTFAVHIKDKRVNKGTGLVRIAERMGIALKEFAAIGDSLSDVAMFELAGFRAAVQNSNIELKEISDYVARTKYGNGFAEIIEYMIQEKML